MAVRTAVPSDVEPESVVDLVADCRELSGRLPSPADTVPAPRGALAVEISRGTAAAYEGLTPYGV